MIGLVAVDAAGVLLAGGGAWGLVTVARANANRIRLRHEHTWDSSYEYTPPTEGAASYTSDEIEQVITKFAFSDDRGVALDKMLKSNGTRPGFTTITKVCSICGDVKMQTVSGRASNPNDLWKKAV